MARFSEACTLHEQGKVGIENHNLPLLTVGVENQSTVDQHDNMSRAQMSGQRSTPGPKFNDK
jgi:hypothetical protein